MVPRSPLLVRRRSVAMSESYSMSKLLRPTGTISRGKFVILGVGLMLLKFALDSQLSVLAFGRHWEIYNYLSGRQAILAISAQPEDRPYYLIMLLLSLPFIWAGVILTVKRLRSAKLPLWLTVFFFAPVLKFPFFCVLAVVPAKVVPEKTKNGSERGIGSVTSKSWLRILIPKSKTGQFGTAVAYTTLLGLVLTFFNVYALGVYGLGLFIGLPFCLSMLAGLILGFRQPCTLANCVQVAIASIFALVCCMMVFNLEGAMCMLMAFPLWAGCAALGAVVGYFIQLNASDEREMAFIMVTLLLVVPALMGAEIAALPVAPTFAVRTSVEVDAAPETVWPNVIQFPPLPSPKHWAFRAGVAYPIGAEITGEGVGAVRRCEFSTGSFVEPIEVWDAPRLLRFSVTENPSPLEEFTLYGDAHPPHLEGFMVSRAGQFHLTQTETGQTLLEGTTWYQHHMWPATYWRWWSDWLIHRIHLRVLDHVAALSEMGETSNEHDASSSK